MTKLLKKAMQALDRLPKDEQDRYARSILDNLEAQAGDGVNAEAVQPLAAIIGTGKGMFKDAAEADAYIRSERDSWDA